MRVLLDQTQTQLLASQTTASFLFLASADGGAVATALWTVAFIIDGNTCGLNFVVFNSYSWFCNHEAIFLIK